MTNEERKAKTAAKAAAFIAAVQAVMKEHEVTDFQVEMVSGHYEYCGAHINIEFKSHNTPDEYEYFDSVNISSIEPLI
jgi:hypothetical protein